MEIMAAPIRLSDAVLIALLLKTQHHFISVANNTPQDIGYVSELEQMHLLFNFIGVN